ncbi:MAG TPA: HAD family hydrolase, partial [Thermovirga lienii]|nr:HAD family hydrolase [Thermovirga lienii]
MPFIFPPFWHPAQAGGFILDWDGVLANTKLNFQRIRDKYFNGRLVPLLESGRLLEEKKRLELERDL